MKFLKLTLFFYVFVFCLMACNRNKTSSKALSKEEDKMASRHIENPTTTFLSSDENETSKKVDSSESTTTNAISSDLFFSNKSKGCGSFELYKLSLDKKVGLYVSGDRKKLGLSKEYQSFEITKNEYLYISIYEFDGEATSFYCDDVADDNPNVLNSWKAVAGKVTAKITQDSINVQGPEMTYKMTLKIESTILKDTKNEIMEIKNIIFEDVLVGWFPG